MCVPGVSSEDPEVAKVLAEFNRNEAVFIMEPPPKFVTDEGAARLRDEIVAAAHQPVEPGPPEAFLPGPVRFDDSLDPHGFQQ